MNKPKIICIVGPTAVGKSALALSLAIEKDGEIVSCDSMQIYKGMDIGTAKPTKEEMAEVRHHMIDICTPDTPYSCADYVRDAKACIDDILSRCKLPIICGGTGLYLESLLYNGGMNESSASDPALREKLSSRTSGENYKELLEIDPASAEKIHPNNTKRVIRALEIYYLTGITKTEADKLSRKESMYDFDIYALLPSDREALYKRIDDRVDKMIENGLVDEVKRLKLSPDTTAGQAIGYKEISAHLRGECSLEEAVNEVKKASRNYAKRQITWWRRNKDCKIIEI